MDSQSNKLRGEIFTVNLLRRRGRRWELDGRKVMAMAKRFAFPPLLDHIRREHFAAPDGRIQTGGTI
jgi:hypothetical protein